MLQNLHISKIMRNFAVDFGREILKLTRKRVCCCNLTNKIWNFLLQREESEYRSQLVYFMVMPYNIPTWSIISLLFLQRFIPEPVGEWMRDDTPRFYLSYN